MFGGISAPFIHRPVATTLVMVAIFLVGLVAFPSLPVAPLPQVDFPTISVSAALPGASPETMATSVAQPLERQIAQIPGVSQMTSTSSLGATAITVQFDLDRNIDAAANDIQAAINAAGGPIAEGPADPADLSQGQPVRHAHSHPVGPVRRRPDHRRRRRGGKHPRPAHQPDFRRVPGAGRRPADPGDPHPDRPGEAGREEPSAGGRAGADRHCDGRQPERRDHRTEAGFHDLRQRPADHRRTLERRDRRLSQRRSRARARHRPSRRGSDRHHSGGLVERQAQRLPGRVQAARRERHQHRRGDQEDADEPRGGDSALNSCQGALRPHDDHPRIGQGRRADADTDHRAGRDGDLRLPAQFVGDDHSERDGAAGAARRLRADVDGELQPRQPVADGLHHRGRLRRRRRHRDAGEHHAPHRGRREAVAGGPEGLGRNRLHHHFDLRFADGGADSAPDDGRHHRPFVPGVLGHDRHDDRGLGLRGADADPDDGLALPQGA